MQRENPSNVQVCRQRHSCVQRNRQCSAVQRNPVIPPSKETAVNSSSAVRERELQ